MSRLVASRPGTVWEFPLRTKTPLQAEKILTAAARLFASQHFHEVRMEDIAAAAEVGKGTLYRYFKDKDELYEALLARAAEDMPRRLHAAVDAATGPRARLLAATGALIDYFREQPHLFDLIQHAEVTHTLSPDSPWQHTRNDTTACVRGIMEEGTAAGVFEVADAEVATMLLLGGIRAVLRFGQNIRPRGVAQRILFQFLSPAERVREKQRTLVSG